MKLCVIYHRPQDLVRDHEQQFARGGLLVQVEPPPDLQLFSTVGLEVRTPFGAADIEAQVIQILPGAGVAVGFDPGCTPALTAAIERARAAGERDGAPPEHAVAPPADPPDMARTPPTGPRRKSRRAPAQAVDVQTRIKNAPQHEKMQIALKGSREERGFIIRDPTAKMLHPFVLKNPHLQLDEVAAIAALRTVAPDTLKFIAERREWAQRPEIASALVRNPKTPVPLAVKLVNFLSAADLRQLAKTSNLRAPVLKAVRRKVLG